MFTLIVYLITSQSLDTIQIDGFQTKSMCQDAFITMVPTFNVYLTSNNGSMQSYCIEKGKLIK